MAALLLDRVLETTTTTGTGTVNLAGAQTGYNAFRDEADDGATVYYLIVNNPASPTAWEYGLGTLTYGTPDTLSRDTVIDSSNSGSKITIASGPSYTVLSPGGKDALQPESVAKTSAYTLTMADIGNFLSCDASSAGFTVTLPAASTATARYWAFIANTGASNAVTIDPNGSETINGATTLSVRPGQATLIRCDGTEWAATLDDLGAVAQDIVPATDSTYDLGSASSAYAEGHIDKVFTDTFEDRSTGGDVDALYIVKGTPKFYTVVNQSAATTAASMNFSSGSDNGVGDWTWNFTTSFANANYAFSGNVSAIGGGATVNPDSAAAGSVRTRTRDNSGTLFDGQTVQISIIGDLA